jgi:predicted lipid-binding transport protein (Tim44 family)
MDFESLDLRVVPGAEFELLHPGSGEGLRLFPTVQSYDSEGVEEAQREVRRRAAKAKTREEATAILGTQRVAMAKAALSHLRSECEMENAPKDVDGLRAKLELPGYIWAVEQIEAFAGDRASFFPKPETD